MKEGERVTVVCAGKAHTAVVKMTNDKGQPLVLVMDDGLRTPKGFYADMVPVVADPDGSYREALGGILIEIAVTQ